MRYQEIIYEDELDRMRARHYQKKTVSHSRKTSVSQKSVQHQTHMRASQRRKNKWLMLVLLLAVFLIGGWFIRKMKDDGYWTVAVYGLDSREGRTGKGALADVQMIASINRRTGEIRLASVFRDTYLQIDSDGDFNKINEAYFLGGYEQAVTAYEDNFDLEIDDCATFNWKAVADAINVLGGIDLEISDQEFAYINSFITETVESTGIGSVHLEKSGMNHLDGVQAVAYARLRLMDTDFKRTERQRKVIGLAMEKVKQANFKTLKALVATVYPEIFTTIRVDDILSLAKNAKKYYIGQTSGFPFSHIEMKIGKKSCVVPTTLESNVIQLHAFLYDDMDYKPSDLVRYISAHIAEISGLTEPGKDVESGKNIGSQDNIGSGKSISVPVSKEEKEETDHQTEIESVIDSETIPLEDTNPENMEQGPGVSEPNVIAGPGSILDALFGENEDETIPPGEEPGTVSPEDVLSGPGIESDPAGSETGSPTVNAGNSNGNALEAPPGESKPPTETAAIGLKPGETKADSDDTTGPGAGNKKRRDADGPGWWN